MKVLLVDDDRSTRYLIGRVLTKRFGCEVTEAGDGRQALEALSHDRFHLVFLDVQMPVMDGLETLRTLRESPEHAALQVVMLTGERDETIIRKILELGVFEYMVKPLNMARLADRLRRMLRTIIAQRDGAPTDPGWFGQALRHIDAPLLIIEGRTPFRRCFAETFGVHRPVIEAESGVAGMRDIVASNPGVVFIGDDLGVLSEPLLRRIRSSPAFCHIPRVALADDEEGDARLIGYDGTLVRTLSPETLLRRMADLMRPGGAAGMGGAGIAAGLPCDGAARLRGGVRHGARCRDDALRPAGRGAGGEGVGHWKHRLLSRRIRADRIGVRCGNRAPSGDQSLRNRRPHGPGRERRCGGRAGLRVAPDALGHDLLGGWRVRHARDTAHVALESSVWRRAGRDALLPGSIEGARVLADSAADQNSLRFAPT